MGNKIIKIMVLNGENLSKMDVRLGIKKYMNNTSVPPKASLL